MGPVSNDLHCSSCCAPVYETQYVSIFWLPSKIHSYWTYCQLKLLVNSLKGNGLSEVSEQSQVGGSLSDWVIVDGPRVQLNQEYYPKDYCGLAEEGKTEPVKARR